MRVVGQFDHGGVHATTDEKPRQERKLIEIPELAIPAVHEQDRWALFPVFAGAEETSPDNIIVRRSAGEERGKTKIPFGMEFRPGRRDTVGPEEALVRKHCLSFLKMLRRSFANPHAGASGADRQLVQRFS